MTMGYGNYAGDVLNLGPAAGDIFVFEARVGRVERGFGAPPTPPRVDG